jgi:hypothetical protein
MKNDKSIYHRLLKTSAITLAVLGLASLMMGQLPINTVRVPVMTDGSNVLNTLVIYSNTVRAIQAPVGFSDVVRLQDLSQSTNFVAVSIATSKTLSTNAVLGGDIGAGTAYTNLVSIVSPGTNGSVMLFGYALLRNNNASNPSLVGYRILSVFGSSTGVVVEIHSTTATGSGSSQSQSIGGFESGLTSNRTYILQGRVDAGSGDFFTSTNSNFGVSSFTATNATGLRIIQVPP